MSLRNRYYVATAQGKLCLSIPLFKGRNQRAPMTDIQISYAENWRQQHWRTLSSAYNRSPYFEYYKDSLRMIYEKDYERLIDFNIASIHWVKGQLRLDFQEEFIDVFRKQHQSAADVRVSKQQMHLLAEYPRYYQVFEERNAFIPNLSILDLLFNEGRNAPFYLKSISK